jgi:hypothetical protein
MDTRKPNKTSVTDNTASNGATQNNTAYTFNINGQSALNDTINSSSPLQELVRSFARLGFSSSSLSIEGETQGLTEEVEIHGFFSLTLCSRKLLALVNIS